VKNPPLLRGATKWASALGLLCIPRTAEAQYSGNIDSGYYLLPGLTTSTVMHRTGKVSGFLGGEVSLAYVDGRNATWYGGYFDAGYDFGSKGTRVSLGPEYGYYYCGVDGGLLLEERATGWGKGFVARGYATIGVAAIYARYGQVVTDDRDRFFELGLLLKLPGYLGH